MTISVPHSSFESRFIWIRACDRTTVVHMRGQQLCMGHDRTTVVVHVTGQQLSFMWQDNYRAYDRTIIMRMTGQQLSCMWQDNSCRACDRTTVVVHVIGQQLSRMLQDNYRAYDRTTVVELTTGQQLSCMWQDNSCCDRFYAILSYFWTEFVSFNCIISKETMQFQSLPTQIPWTPSHLRGLCITSQRVLPIK